MAPERLLNVVSSFSFSSSVLVSVSSMIGSIIAGKVGSTTTVLGSTVGFVLVSSDNKMALGSVAAVVSSGGQYGTYSHQLSPLLLYLIT